MNTVETVSTVRGNVKYNFHSYEVGETRKVPASKIGRKGLSMSQKHGRISAAICMFSKGKGVRFTTTRKGFMFHVTRVQ